MSKEERRAIESRMKIALKKIIPEKLNKLEVFISCFNNDTELVCKKALLVNKNICMNWWKKYLYLVDLSLEIRTGEIRHKCDREFLYPCVHLNRQPNSSYTGESIDDCNVLFGKMTNLKSRESLCDQMGMQLDSLDRTLQGYEESLKNCIKTIESSVFSIKLSGKDPHQVMELSYNNESICLTRECRSPLRCECNCNGKDSNEFIEEYITTPLKDEDFPTIPIRSTKVYSESTKVNEEFGINSIKKVHGVDGEELERNYNEFLLENVDNIEENEMKSSSCNTTSTNTTSSNVMSQSLSSSFRVQVLLDDISLWIHCDGEQDMKWLIEKTKSRALEYCGQEPVITQLLSSNGSIFLENQIISSILHKQDILHMTIDYWKAGADIREVYLKHCVIRGIEPLSNLEESIEQVLINPKHFTCPNNSILSTQDFQAFLMAISSLQTIEQIEIIDTYQTEKSIEFLCNCLKRKNAFPQLSSLNFRGSCLSSLSIEIILKTASLLPFLVELDISFTFLNSQSLQVLKDFLSNTKQSLKRLGLAHTIQDNEIILAAENFNSLQFFDFSQNFFKAFEGNSRSLEDSFEYLHVISLSKEEILSKICLDAFHLSKLRELKAGYNLISDSCLDKLKSSIYLNSLDLRYCSISSSTLAKFSSNIFTNFYWLETLVLRGIPLEKETVVNLLHAPLLQTLDLAYCFLNEEVIIYVLENFSKKKISKILDLSGNRILLREIDIFQCVLAEISNMKRIDLSNLGLDFITIKLLADTWMMTYNQQNRKSYDIGEVTLVLEATEEQLALEL